MTPPPRNHTRKTSQSKPKPGHEKCQHHYKLQNLGIHPQPTEPWRPYIFRVHCLVTMRWMKVRVPFAWFWYGSQEFGTPEVEMGEIARQPQMATLPDPSIIEEEPKPPPPPETLEQKVDRLERLASSAFDATHPQGRGR